MIQKQHLSKVMTYCVRSERCVLDVQRKMMEWNIPKTDFQIIIDTLIDDGFIDEERYVRAFINDKIKFNHWGKKKVRLQLLQKGLSSQIITNFLQQFPEDIYLGIAKNLIQKKSKQLLNDSQKYNKVTRYMLGKGFEYDLVHNIFNETDSCFAD